MLKNYKILLLKLLWNMPDKKKNYIMTFNKSNLINVQFFYYNSFLDDGEI